MKRHFIFFIAAIIILQVAGCNVKAAKPEVKSKKIEKNTVLKAEPEKKHQPEKIQNPEKKYFFSFQKEKTTEKNFSGIKEYKPGNKTILNKEFSSKNFFLSIGAFFVILLIAFVVFQNKASRH